MLACHVYSLKKELNLQDKVLKIKLIKEALNKRECEEFETSLQYKLKLSVYKELTCGLGIFETCKGTLF